MPSPFPGMDPFLERSAEWSEFHNQYVQDLQRQLVRTLPGGYRARTETDLYIHEPTAEERRMVARADASVVVGPDRPAGGVAVASAVEPATRLDWPEMLPEELHRYIEVRTKDDRQVVTVIELLSPTNKADGLTQFQAKRHGLHAAGVHFLQIDLLRGGGPRLLPEAVPPHDYNAMLLRGGDTAADVWMWTLRDPLPVLPVPLAGDDADVTLDLRAALDATYDANQYDRFIYNGVTPTDLDPPLDAAAAAWAAGRVPARA